MRQSVSRFAQAGPYHRLVPLSADTRQVINALWHPCCMERQEPGQYQGTVRDRRNRMTPAEQWEERLRRLASHTDGSLQPPIFDGTGQCVRAQYALHVHDDIVALLAQGFEQLGQTHLQILSMRNGQYDPIQLFQLLPG